MTNDYVCPNCQKHFPEYYWGVSGHPGGFGTIRKPGFARANFERHEKACRITFNTVITFVQIPIGGQFVEGFSESNEIATRIEPTTITHKGKDKEVNARRSGGKYIWMWDWEPVFVEEAE